VVAVFTVADMAAEWCRRLLCGWQIHMQASPMAETRRIPVLSIGSCAHVVISRGGDRGDPAIRKDASELRW